MNCDSQRGLTLVELLAVLALAGMAVGATVALSVPILARESIRSVAYDAETYLQLTRIESVKRNVECRFAIDLAERWLRVTDTRGTASTADDEVLHQASFPASVVFARPDPGPAVTLDEIAPDRFEAAFTPDGAVTRGAGAIHMLGGERHLRVVLLGAGGVMLQRWDGGAWVRGG